MGELEASLKVAKSLMGMPFAGLIFQDGRILCSGKVDDLKWEDFSSGLSYSLLLSSSRYFDVQNTPSVPLFFSKYPCLSSVFVEPLANHGVSLFFLSNEACQLDIEHLEEHIATLVDLFSTLLTSESSPSDSDKAHISYEDLLKLNNNVPVFIALVDQNLRYEFVNDTYERRFSILKDNVVGVHVKEHIPLENFPAIKAKLEEALQGKPTRFHYDVCDGGRDGERRFIEAFYMPRINQGEVTGLYLCMQDVTTQRRTLRTLQRLHEVTANTSLSLDEKLQRILHVGAEQFALPIGLISSIKDDLYRVEYSHTPNGEVMPGASFELGNTYCVHTLQSDLPTSYFHTAISDIKEHPCYQNFGLEAYIGIVLYVGGKRWGTLNFSSPNPKKKAFGDDDYEVMKLLAQWVGNEMTRQQNETKLTTTERQQRLILEAVHEGIFGVNNDGVITFANSAACRILNTSLEALLDKPLFPILSHRDENGDLFTSELSPIQKTLMTGESVQSRSEYFGENAFVCEYTCIAMRSSQGGIEGAVISFQDRTEQVQAEIDLREQKIFFESLFVNAPEAIILVGSDRKIKMINPAFTELFGYELEDVLEESTQMLYVNESDFKKRGTAYTIDRESVLSRYRVSYKNKQGEVFHTETIGSMIPNPDGSLGGYIAHVRDVSERLEVEQKMIDTNLRLSIATDVAGIGVWELDLEDYTLHWDEWMYRLYNSSEGMGESPIQIWEECVYPEDRLRLDEVFVRLEEGGAYFGDASDASSISQYLDTDFKIVRKDGQTRYLKSNATIVFDKEGRASRLVGVNMDITSRKETEVVLREASEQALAASKAKSDFLATMSHEIRTPLNGVLGMAELLSSSKLDSEQSEQLRILKESGEGLLSLINDLLDFSKIEAGHLSIERVDFDLEKAIYDVARLLMVKAEEKNIDLLVEYDDSCPRFFVGDVFRIKQILINLMSNAIKFTNFGHVLVSVKGVVDQQGVVSVTINVIDTGVGVAKEAQPYLFNAFVQADSSTTRKFGGTGLGLAITKQLVGLMQGDVSLSSELGVGSTFTVQFTLPESHAIPKIEALVDEALLVGKKTLVIDDNETNLTILKNQLKSCEIYADIEISPVDALARIKQAIKSGAPYDIIILDYMMPELDGLMLAQLIRTESNSMAHPVLLMTSSAGLPSQEELIVFGVNVCIAKPMGAVSLKKGLILAMSSGSVGQQFSSGELSRLDSKESENSACDLRKGVILVVEDMKANMAVAKGILVKMGFEVIEAENGAIGIEQWERHNPDLIFMDLHMPVMDGLSAMRRIRQAEKNSHNKRVPILALTADIMPGTFSEVLRAGGDGLVPKPFKQKELIGMLDKWLSVDHQAVISEGVGDLLVESVFDVQSDIVIDESILNDLKAILGDDYLLLIDAFFSDADDIIDSFKKMIEGEDMSDYTSISQLSHSLKSVSQNVGAMTLSSMAAQLELESRQYHVPESHAKLDELIVMYQNAKNELQRIAAGL